MHIITVVLSSKQLELPPKAKGYYDRAKRLVFWVFVWHFAALMSLVYSALFFHALIDDIQSNGTLEALQFIGGSFFLLSTIIFLASIQRDRLAAAHLNMRAALASHEEETSS